MSTHVPRVASVLARLKLAHIAQPSDGNLEALIQEARAEGALYDLAQFRPAIKRDKVRLAMADTMRGLDVPEAIANDVINRRFPR